MSFRKERHLNAISEKCNALNQLPSKSWLYVSIKEQRLYHYRGEQEVKAYAISTSARPPSCVENSLGTPTGLHRIAQKIGADAAPGMIFKGRVATGDRYWETPPEARSTNYVTTRILWLEGLEPGYNQGEDRDSFKRYIYIHGTNHEARIGVPQSHGCILMTNEDVIELYNAVKEADLVYIAER